MKRILSPKLILIISASIVLLLSLLIFRPKEKTVTQKTLTPVASITHAHGLAVNPTDNSKIYIATHEGLFTLIDEKEMYQVGQSKDDYMGFTAHPNNPDIFYSSGHPVAGGNIGFQKSTDGAFEWKKVSDGNEGPVDFHALTISPIDTNLLYGWYRGNIQRSTDEGNTWQSIRTANPIVNLVADTADKDTLYASGPRGLQKSTDGGQTFTTLLVGFTSAIAVNPSNAKHVFTYNEKLQLAESKDGGQTWQTRPQDFSGQTPLFMAFYKADPKIAYLLTEKSNLFKSTDGGQTWLNITKS